MIDKLPNPEETVAKLSEKQCKKLQSASKRIEKQVNSDIQSAIGKIADKI